MKTKGKLTAPDGWTLEYDFSRPRPQTIVVCNEAGEKEGWTTFHFTAGLDMLIPYIEAFEEEHKGSGQLRLKVWAELTEDVQVDQAGVAQ